MSPHSRLLGGYFALTGIYNLLAYWPVVPGCMSIFHGIKQSSEFFFPGYIYFLLQSLFLAKVQKIGILPKKEIPVFDF